MLVTTNVEAFKSWLLSSENSFTGVQKGIQTPAGTGAFMGDGGIKHLQTTATNEHPHLF